jgi:hypothetical protein
MRSSVASSKVCSVVPESPVSRTSSVRRHRDLWYSAEYMSAEVQTSLSARPTRPASTMRACFGEACVEQFRVQPVWFAAA